MFNNGCELRKVQGKEISPKRSLHNTRQGLKKEKYQGEIACSIMDVKNGDCYRERVTPYTKFTSVLHCTPYI